jgi:hypothetical protein
MGTSEAIRQIVAKNPPGAVFSCADFVSLGTRASIDQALFRMMRAGLIERVARGLYATAGQQVDARVVAGALAQKTGEQVALTPSMGSGDIVVVPTTGLSRTVKAAGRTVRFRRMSRRKVLLAASAKGRTLLDLWNRGRKNLTTLEIQRATSHWMDGEIAPYATLIPAWLRSAIQLANAPRKSVTIGLSGAYDWSNPNIRDDVLIAKVLEKHKFEDVARLCLHYGISRVTRTFRRHSFDPMATASVSRMLRNIRKGLRAPQEQVHA